MRKILSDELRDKLERKLSDLHGGRLPDCRFAVEAWLESERVCARLTVQSHDKSLHYPMEAAAAVDDDSPLVVDEALGVALDFLGFYLGEYVTSDGEVLLPLDWQAFTFGDREVFARGWERNLALEEAADRFLAGEPIDEEALGRSVRPRRRP